MTTSNLQIGLIAGGGQFPIIFAKRARAKGLRVYAAAYANEADPQLEQHVAGIEWLHLGQVRRLLKFFKQHDVAQTVMMGTIRKTRIFTPKAGKISSSADLRDKTNIEHLHKATATDTALSVQRFHERSTIIVNPVRDLQMRFHNVLAVTEQ